MHLLRMTEAYDTNVSENEPDDHHNRLQPSISIRSATSASIIRRERERELRILGHSSCG
jgi:hypothetical protein